MNQQKKRLRIALIISKINSLKEKQNFSKAKISEAWEKYREEGGALSNKEKN